MSVNSSCFSDLPLLPPHLSSSSNSSFHPLMDSCYKSKMSIYIFSTLSITNLLLLPLLILVLYLGYQQWRKQSSISTTATSHSDIFTYHSIAMQLNEVLGFTLFFCGNYISILEMAFLGLGICSVTSFGEAMFHLLTCVERYVAVVHPITYLRLRRTGGVRIRNISVGCVWLLSFGWIVVYYYSSSQFKFIVYICIMFFFVLGTSFCSVAVLCALKRPGPGKVGWNRERVDQSKQRAFNTIMAIMGVLLLRFGGNLIGNLMYNSGVLSPSKRCVLMLSAFGFNLPSRLLLPLLFLHRAGKLQCCKPNIESG